MPRHPSFLLKINTISFSLSLFISLSLSLFISLSLSLSLYFSMHDYYNNAAFINVISKVIISKAFISIVAVSQCRSALQFSPLWEIEPGTSDLMVRLHGRFCCPFLWAIYQSCYLLKRIALWSRWYKTFFVCNLRSFVISWSVCPWQAFLA